VSIFFFLDRIIVVVARREALSRHLPLEFEVLVSEPLNFGLCCFVHLCKQRDLVEVWSHLSVVSRSFISDSAVMLSMRT